MSEQKTTISILLVEDDPNLGTFLRSYLITKGYSTVLCSNGDEALKEFKTGKYNFCITDIMMPIKDGFTLAKEIRRLNSNVPLLFLTAKTLEEDKLRGFQLGADDYITKPFSMEELLLRIQAIIRRSSIFKETNYNSVFDFGETVFNYNRQQIETKDGKSVNLTSKEAELLLILCSNANEVVERRDALQKVWKDDNYFNARSMDVYITKLRKILKMYTEAEILNVHGVGFKLILKK